MHRCIKQKNVSKFHFQIALIQQQFASNDRNTYYEKEGGGGVHEFHMVSQQHNNSSGFSDARLAKVCDKFD